MFGTKKLNGSQVVAAALTTFTETLEVLDRGVTLIEDEMSANSDKITALFDKQEALSTSKDQAERVQRNIRQMLGL